MRILVTGGAGFIGSHIVDQLVLQGDEVLVVDNLATGKRSNLPEAARLVELDIADPCLRDVVASFQPDVVSHVAAQASVSLSMKDPIFDAQTNIIGGLNVFQTALEAGCAQFIYVTTGGALYGVPEYLPCDEGHPIRPLSGYGLSKWTLEAYLHMLTPPTVSLKVLRLANIYGPRQDPHGEAGVVAIFTDRMLDGQPVCIYGDGEQTRDFVYVGDVVEAHRLALQTDVAFSANIGTEKPLSVNRLFEVMARETGYNQPAVHAAERPGDIKHSVLANGLARKILGWTPRTSLDDGLRQTIAWARAVRASA